MGRKIPAKKHRGVKDPIQQQERRYQSIRGKINAPPKDPDEQPVPRSLTRLFAFQNKDKKVIKRKKLKTAPSHTGPAAGEGGNPIARLRRLPGESGRGFSLRINSAVKALHDPLEQDYSQELEANDTKGEQMAAQRARRLRKRKCAAPSDPADPAAPPQHKLTRGQKLTRKKIARKEKALEGARPDVEYERVAFGDVAHAPPALPAPRRAAPALAAPRPGSRDLLLNALLPGGKQRALPPAELLRRERARLDVVAAYRQQKKLRKAEHNNRKKNK